MMVRKYEEAIAHSDKMKANKEFLMLQKILLKDAVNAKEHTGKNTMEHCPLVGVVGTKRIEIYDDEITYSGKNSVIQFV